MRPGTGNLHHSLQDIAAAIAIARKPGENAHPATLQPLDGEIERVQADSRRVSGGRTTIPRSLASRVARGELPLEEALRLHANGAVPDADGEDGDGWE